MRYVLWPLALSALISMSACSLKSAGQSTTLKIPLPQSQSGTARFSAMSMVSALSTTSNYFIAPTSLSDFDCFAVNVVGEGIAPNPASQYCTNSADLLGVVGGWIPASTINPEIVIDVPQGAARTIQLYGVRTPDACPKLGEVGTTRLGSIYLIGQATQDIFQDSTVTIHASIANGLQAALSSCNFLKTSGSGVIASNATYYVMSGSPVTLPIVTDNTTGSSVQLVSVGSPAKSGLGTTAAVDGTRLAVVYHPQSTTGTDTFSYAVIDSSGNTATATITVKSMTPYTWTGAAGNQLWSVAANWCGSVNANHTACVGAGTVPATADVVTFDETCTTSCDVTQDVAVMIAQLKFAQGYTGTLTQGSNQLHVTGATQMDGGTFVMGSAANVIYFQNSFNMTGGTITGGGGVGSGSIGLISGVTISNGVFDLSNMASVSLSNVTLSGGTFSASSSAITINDSMTYNGGTVVPNGGLIIFYTAGASTLTLNSALTLSHVRIEGAASSSYTLTGTSGHLIANGNLDLQGDGAGTTLMGGVIHARGSVTNSSYGFKGSTWIYADGSSSQSVTGLAGAYFPSLKIVSTGGTVTLNGTLEVDRNYAYHSGTVNSGTSTINFYCGVALTVCTTLPGASVSYYAVNFKGDYQLGSGLIVGNTLHLYNPATLNAAGYGIDVSNGSLILDTGTTLNRSGGSLLYGSLTGSGTIVP